MPRLYDGWEHLSLGRRKWYVRMLAIYSHCSSISSQGELEHRRVKRLYGRTNKNKYEEQIAKQEQRQRTLREVRRRLKDADNANVNPPAEIPLKKKSLKQSLNDHYYISSSGQTSVTISEYLTAHQNDTAFTVGHLP